MPTCAKRAKRKRLCYYDSMETMRWRYYEMKRLWRLYVDPEPSARRLMKVVGVFWLWRHGVKREYKIRLWKDSKGWYAVDFAAPHLQKAIEADGAIHAYTQQHDIVRDQRLTELGWQVIRVSDLEVRTNPRGVRRRVRRFLRS